MKKNEKINSNKTDEQQKPINNNIQNFWKIINKRISFVKFKTQADNEKKIPKELNNKKNIDYPDYYDDFQKDFNTDLQKYNGYEIKHQNINQNYIKKIEKKLIYLWKKNRIQLKKKYQFLI